MTKQRRTRSDKGKPRKLKTKPMRVPIIFIENIKDFIKKLIKDLENN